MNLLKRFSPGFLLLILIINSCKPSPTATDLYGKWKYIKSEQPNANPPDSTSSGDLKIEDPSIQFFKDNTLQIWWGGKMISHGKFTIEDKKIQYTETLPDGSSRKFPFWIMDFTGKLLVFYTTGEDGARITAVKE